jgi:hypothetical protein
VVFEEAGLFRLAIEGARVSAALVKCDPDGRQDDSWALLIAASLARGVPPVTRACSVEWNRNGAVVPGVLCRKEKIRALERSFDTLPMHLTVGYV